MTHKIAADKAESYRNARLRARRPSRTRNNGNGNLKTGKQKKKELLKVKIFYGNQARCPHCGDAWYVVLGVVECRNCSGKFRAVAF